MSKETDSANSYTVKNADVIQHLYNYYCTYKLPCGLCEKTLKECPKASVITATNYPIPQEGEYYATI